MVKRGRVTYVPKPVFVEIESIMNQGGIKRQSKAFNEMVRYSEIGRKTSIKKPVLKRGLI